MSRPLDPRLLRHARTSRPGLAGLALLGAGQAAATLLLAVALTLFVAGPRGHAVPLLVLAYLARAVFALAEPVVARRTAARVIDELRRSVLAAALRRGPAWVAGFGSGRLIAVLTNGLDALRPWFGGYLPALILGVALPPLVLIAMAVVDPASAVVALLTLPLIPVLGALIGWATQARAKQRWQADARLAGHFLDVVRGLTTLRMYGRAERQVDVVAAMTDRHRGATMRVLRVAFLSSTALNLVGTLSVGLIAVEAGLRVAGGGLGLGPALLVILLAPEVYRPLREMAARYHASADAAAVITDVDGVLAGVSGGNSSTDSRPGRADRGGATAGPSVRTTPSSAGDADGHTGAGDRPATAGASVAGLRVRYPGSTVDALRLDRLDVRGGELVALRGPSGAGKTTALRVLAGLQPARRGTVSVTGPAPLYLPQRPALAHARTVRDVVGSAEALRVVGLDQELSLETPLGEHGHGVSAGQRQRLALAALLTEARPEAVTLLLDEPTAHLDPVAEEAVIEQLRAAAARGCAVLVVAHRPALLGAVDRIVDIAGAEPSRPSPAIKPTPAAAALAPTPNPTPSAAPNPAAGAGAGAARNGKTRLGAVPAVAVGAGSWVPGIVLTGAAAWLLVRASALPPVLTLSTAVVLVRASAVARPLLRYVERLVSHNVAFARLGHRRARVYADLIPRVPGPRIRRRGELLSRVVDDVDADVDGLLRGRLPAASAVIAAALIAGAAILLLPAVTVPLVAGLLIAGVAAPGLAARLAARREAATGQARAELRDAVVETVDGIEELAVRGAGALAVPGNRSRVLAHLEARAARAAGLATGLAHLGWGVAVAGTALVLSRTGELSPEWSAVLLLAVVALAEPVAGLPDSALARQRAIGARARLADLTSSDPPITRPGTRTGPPADDGLVVRGLVAGWDPGRAPVIDGLDLDIPRGGSLALTGVSGSGKSTLAAVLAGLLEPRAGSIRFGGSVILVGDGTDHVFASTLRENLRLADPGAPDAQLIRVLERVGLVGWDLDAWLGTGGTTISGGQRKRLATARALLAVPDLLILDEPTEGLDVAGAEALMTDLLGAADGRTVLVLTHRTEGLELVGATSELRNHAHSSASSSRTCSSACSRVSPGLSSATLPSL